MSFEEQFEQMKREFANTRLNILVWGPGQGDAEGYRKREKIRETIRQAFPNADVKFSEDLIRNLEETLPGSASDFEFDEQELWHLGACDVCVVLDISPGAAGEIARYSRSQYSNKLLILTPKRFEGVNSFPAALRRHLNQIFYTDEEFTSCSLVGRVLSRVHHVALAKRADLRA